LTSTRFTVVATPDYLEKHDRPRRPEEIAAHQCLAFVIPATGLMRPWQFQRDGTPLAFTPESGMSFTDGAALCVAACAGFGLAQLHDYYTEDAIAAGRLKAVLQRFAPPPDPISLVYPATRHLAPKVRAFVDFLAARFRAKPTA